jgi:hypothetical protein
MANFNLKFRIPIWAGVLVTGVDVYLHHKYEKGNVCVHTV